MTLEAEIVEAAGLSVAHRERWLAFAGMRPELDAPCFDPEFVCGLAEHIPDCKVAILKRGGEPIGYLAFVRKNGQSIARPIPMCDYQPLVLSAQARITLRDIVRLIGVRSWHFSNLALSGGLPRETTRSTVAPSPRIVVKHGVDAYSKALLDAGKSIKKYPTQIRYLQRDHGQVALVHRSDPETLDSLLNFKAGRYAPGGDFEPWVSATLRHFLDGARERVQGRLLVLNAGETPTAYLMCLKRGHLLYYWFPTYDPAFRKYSPGMVALWLLVSELPTLGCDTIDLGPGGEAYKDYFANAHMQFASGEVDANPIVAATRLLYHKAQVRLRSNPAVDAYVRPAVKWLRTRRPLR